MTDVTNNLAEVAKSIRGLAADAVQKANSGHPGLPLGCAEIGAVLYGEVLRHDPADPNWPDRDRFVLSAGHGSMLQYACLHLAGYPVSLDDLMNFRQWGSNTPGHPEYHETEGVECTTGPLGQGIANAVGMALAARMKAERYNTPEHKVVDHDIIALCGDGCLMEGISYESISLAGHLGLDNLILIYDANDISLDAPLDVSFSEDIVKRFESCGWGVETIDGNDLDAVRAAYANAKNTEGKPSVIVAKTVIGKGSPGKQGTTKCHGAPLGEEEVRLMKEAVGLPQDGFHVTEGAQAHFEGHRQSCSRARADWVETFDEWREANPALAKQWDADSRLQVPSDLWDNLPEFETGQSLATRKSSQVTLQSLAAQIPNFIGGSADLSCSNLTNLDDYDAVQAGRFGGRNVWYGVREHAMGAIVNGMTYYGGVRPFCATFLVFADYLRPAIRLAALNSLPSMFVFTHDSFMVGEDGPTHQPVETVASLRCIPGLHTYRPADANEVKAAYLDALSLKGPSALCFTRQGVETLEETSRLAKDGVAKGAYVIHRERGKEIDHILFASGSEVGSAVEAAKELEGQGLSVRVVSVPCFERFFEQSEEYRNGVLAWSSNAGRWVVEAQVSFGWHRFIGPDGGTITMDRFGASAPGKVLQEKFGFTVGQIVSRISAAKAQAAEG